VTDVKVIDCSALAAFLFNEPDGSSVTAQLGDARLVAPALLSYEIANTCLKKCRRHPRLSDDLLAAYRLLGVMRIEHRTVDHAAVLDLALNTGLSAYDASYLWLARQLGADLVTLDRKLGRVAARR
jgi:predicted nucleic acid-binding protein